MDLEQILEAVDNLSPDDREKLKAHLAKPKTPEKPEWKTGEEWMALLDKAIEEFWGDTSPEEREAIIEAMNIKSKPSAV